MRDIFLRLTWISPRIPLGKEKKKKNFQMVNAIYLLYTLALDKAEREAVM